MTAHDRTLELAAAAFDFRLTPAERDDMDRHLAGCAWCRAELEGMADDARRLASRPVHPMAPSRAEAIRSSLERSRRPMNPAMVLVAAALLMLLGIAVVAAGAQIVRRLDESRLAVDPGPSAAASGVPGPTSTPAGWILTAAGMDQGLPFAPVVVDRLGDRWIAVGAASCVATGEWDYRCEAPTALATVGRAWSMAAPLAVATAYIPPTSGPLAGIVDAAVGPDGFVAVGFSRDGVAEPLMAVPDGAAWWSADGSAWERVRLGDGARPATVLRTDDRWLIGGVAYGSQRPAAAIWTSPDGRAWTRVEDPTTFDVGGYVDTMEDPGAGGIATLATDGSTIVAAGRVCTEGGPPCVAAAWVSGDGVAWERAGSLPAGDEVEGLVAIEGAFIAAARRCSADGTCSTVVLQGADGRTWAAVPGELASPSVLAAAGRTAVIVTGEYLTLDIRASGDGATWTSLGSVAAPGQVSWGRPILVAGAGGVDLLIGFEASGGAGSLIARWEIAPAP